MDSLTTGARVRTRPRVELAMFPDLPPRLFPPPIAERLQAVAEIDLTDPLIDFQSARSRDRLRAADVLLTGWGSPRLDSAALAHAPRLRAVVHAAGTVKGHLSLDVFDRGVPVSSAADANAVPVAEYTLAMILLAGKAVPALAREYRATRADLNLPRRNLTIGNYHRTVGLLGASKIGRRVLTLLRPFDLTVLLSDPYVDAATAKDLGATLVTLDDLFATCDIVSVHAPATEETRGLVTARLLASMPDGATLINTARGSLVDEPALLAELRTGRLSAVLDVTDPEIPPPDSPLWDLPNVVLTPHVAGALGNELHRLGESAAEEVTRALAGQLLKHPVDPTVLAITA
ncbi:hydroxyacid dehydrogenase [Acrocarpospora sp. B8E8]|uniref:hydroxyacid dehydrogenase n=1 Tax=Acrocarpospora sp. B8E8 TaxID=3153572 RepID=UPI00325F01EF